MKEEINLKQEEINLLLSDLCVRIPYNVMLHNELYDYDEYLKGVDIKRITIGGEFNSTVDNLMFRKVIKYKPYLRPMSSMTILERVELAEVCDVDYINDDIVDFGEFLCEGSSVNIKNIYGLLDWLNAHHFDYRGLIEKGLAIEAPKGMYK